MQIIRSLRRLLRTIKVKLFIEVDKYKKADERILSEWFESLYQLLSAEEKKGNVSYKAWYQKPGELELTETPIPTESGQASKPLYKVKILSLPEIVKEHRKYRPQMSEITLAEPIFPENIPEIQSWQLDLIIFDAMNNKVWNDAAFSRYRYSQPKTYIKHEIRYREGRELTAYEVKIIKSIFDSAIKKMNISARSARDGERGLAIGL
ncbi:hypothetical protein A3D78_02960 [Candidatus Gottesmanbacteria bacterium RIFCSPHIGHO2_02_FULL_39_14]|uniref:Uncharacterized protein n=2 Tax=Candidatus Gottesmaniibacteriota TaxID=1752720 RepID=A0A1F5ZTY9_9BACT|nr:MAG: hypothetical protein A3D78_02960 [Candidatus Gottesmanbacteria bacterium RIFCSPHIGHO2_02_FULL_39_14]OGG30884.1 MAG: hypothetical protein A3I51_03835 [Candidatus Gottesmanbacteria bacterium RIFCSPLOWO2_02_FULL_38_8]